ncbi:MULTISPECIES: helix-turn-helix domain-containing protein [Vibrio]|jgi:Ner family transcriptional regulator|uniref:helix-turn-helix domain-containing protein n=1 Tax=Vibrio TaxID=662 RepID=UPI000D34357C|nr:MULTISPECIES: helix-turn-helix transcriptional regulator [Vibrio]PTP90120.1 DNA-binding protein [Vibrio splendidus]
MSQYHPTLQSDWHRADIKAALEKKGLSYAGLARSSGLKSGTLHNAIARHWPKGEKIIADAIGVTPQEIWPSRYQSNAA